jgi:hypothetical protein
MRIVETDNFGGDYPDEKFLNLPFMNEYQAKKIADILDDVLCNSDSYPRFWKVVPDDYKLQPGFEP